jgi:regulator of nucleoside diphosphate kinase
VEALGRACVVACNEIPADVVTMNSQVRLRDEDAGTDMVLSLVYPESADLRRGKVSIFAPIGAALLGSRVGDAVEWKVLGRLRRLRIERIMYQPKWSWI